MSTYLQFLTNANTQINHIKAIHDLLIQDYSGDKGDALRIIANINRIGSAFIEFPKDSIAGLSLSPNGKEFITSNEGGRQHKKYPNYGTPGRFNIGIGHFIQLNEIIPDVITDAEIDRLFKADVDAVEIGLKHLIDHNVQLTQNQYDVLVDFGFQLGINGFPKLVNALNQNDFVQAYKELRLPDPKYDGRTQRRQELFRR
jgi:GH24 family phage-related lysozyme (muramidase)